MSYWKAYCAFHFRLHFLINPENLSEYEIRFWNVVQYAYKTCNFNFEIFIIIKGYSCFENKYYNHLLYSTAKR